MRRIDLWRLRLGSCLTGLAVLLTAPARAGDDAKADLAGLPLAQRLYWTGKYAEAAEQFRVGATLAASTGHRTSESWLLHDLMRTSGEDASARLRDLAGVCDSPLVSARADSHCEGSAFPFVGSVLTSV